MAGVWFPGKSLFGSTGDVKTRRNPSRNTRISRISNSELAFDDLYIGDAWMKIKSISVVPGAAGGPAAGKNMTMSGFDYSAKATRNKDFLDASGKFAIAGT